MNVAAARQKNHEQRQHRGYGGLRESQRNLRMKE
jgi:hypothetical protein